MPVGDPREGKTPLGAGVDAKTVDHVKGLIADALGGGAEQVNGGAANGVPMPAHVIDKVTPAMKLFRDESFGPVVAVVRARDEEHAVELANDTDYGLSCRRLYPRHRAWRSGGAADQVGHLPRQRPYGE